MADNTEFEAPMLDEAPFAEATETASPAEGKDEKTVVTLGIDAKKQSLNAKGPMRWYVIQAFSGFEQRVALTLSERIKLYHMEDDFAEVLVPCIRPPHHPVEIDILRCAHYERHRPHQYAGKRFVYSFGLAVQYKRTIIAFEPSTVIIIFPVQFIRGPVAESRRGRRLPSVLIR